MIHFRISQIYWCLLTARGTSPTLSTSYDSLGRRETFLSHWVLQLF